MHIPPGQVNSNLASNAAHASEAAMAARRSDAMRKKLQTSALEINSASTDESIWTVNARAQGQSGYPNSDTGDQNAGTFVVEMRGKKEYSENDGNNQRKSVSPVSFWA
jgi:hypothetical protein